MATQQNVDFSKVKDGGGFNRKRIPAGDYLATVTKVEDAEAKDGVFQYLISIKINKISSSVLPYYCKLQENQLWKLRNLLIVAGLTVPKRRIKVDPNRLIGKLIGVSIEDDDYDGKEQSSIAGLFPAAELGDADSAPASSEEEPEDEEAEEAEEAEEPEEEPEEAEEAEEEPEEEEDPYADLDRTALKAQLKKLDAAFVAKKSQTDDDLRQLLRDGDSEPETETEEEEEEEAPTPKARVAVKKAVAKRPVKKAAATVTDEELEELDIDAL